MDMMWGTLADDINRIVWKNRWMLRTDNVNITPLFCASYFPCASFWFILILPIAIEIAKISCAGSLLLCFVGTNFNFKGCYCCLWKWSSEVQSISDSLKGLAHSTLQAWFRYVVESHTYSFHLSYWLRNSNSMEKFFRVQAVGQCHHQDQGPIILTILLGAMQVHVPPWCCSVFVCVALGYFCAMVTK